MGDPINANICVQNNFDYTISTVTIVHQFSDNTPQTLTWTNVPAQTISTPTQTATGNTSAGHDYWTCSLLLADISKQIWSHYPGQKTCTLESKDNNQTIIMVVEPGSWTLPLPSGGCSTFLALASTNIAAYVQVQNLFGLEATTIALSHVYSVVDSQSFTFSNVPANGGMTSQVIVTSSTQTGTDYWGMTVTLSNGQVWSHSNKGCNMQASDMDKTITMTVSQDDDDSGTWTLPLPSGGCSTSLSLQTSDDASAPAPPGQPDAPGPDVKE